MKTVELLQALSDGQVQSISQRSKKSNAEKTQMPESESRAWPVIPQEEMLSRLEQSEQMREFFIQMWLQDPALARQGGARILSLVSEKGRANQRKG